MSEPKLDLDAELVERVARAICDVRSKNGVHLSPHGGLSVQKYGPHESDVEYAKALLVERRRFKQQDVKPQLDAVDNVLKWEGSGVGRVGAIEQLQFYAKRGGFTKYEYLWHPEDGELPKSDQQIADLGEKQMSKKSVLPPTPANQAGTTQMNTPRESRLTMSSTAAEAEREQSREQGKILMGLIRLARYWNLCSNKMDPVRAARNRNLSWELHHFIADAVFRGKMEEHMATEDFKAHIAAEQSK